MFLLTAPLFHPFGGMTKETKGFACVFLFCMQSSSSVPLFSFNSVVKLMMIYSTDSVINSREGPGIDTHSKMDESHRTTTKESISRRWCVAASHVVIQCWRTRRFSDRIIN